jgi:hypothetical protein
MVSRRSLALAFVALGLPGCRGGHDAEQLVRKDPATVYAAFADAFAQGSLGGASQYSDLWHGGMQTFVDKASPSVLDVATKFDGKTATSVHFTFTPQDGGKATMVDADVSVDRAVMQAGLAGAPKEALANLPESAFAAGMQRVMAKYANRIESGMPLNNANEGWMTGGGDPPPEFYEGMSEEQKAEIHQHDQEQREDAATAPMVDPEAASRAYLNGHSASR